MSLLLDTHVLLWWLTDDPVLPEQVKARLDDEPEVYVSAASIWEISIKQSIGKLHHPANLPDEAMNSGFRRLEMTCEHAVVAGRLPLLHRDPFDRMLIAQALCEGMTIATHDPQIQKYDVELLRL